MNVLFSLPCISSMDLTKSQFNFLKPDLQRIAKLALATLGILGIAYSLMRCIRFVAKIDKTKKDQNIQPDSKPHTLIDSKKRDVEKPVNDSHLLPLKDLKKGFAVIPLLKEEEIPAHFENLRNFDLQPDSYKQQFCIKDRIEIGYSSLKNKNVFVIRNEQIPEELKNFLPYFSSMHALAHNILKQIEKDLNLESSSLTAAVSKDPLPQGKDSTSLLRLFAYAASDTNGVAADAHEDLGLLTIIPCSQTPALEVLDYTQDYTWTNLEKAANPSSAIVLVGRTLEQMTKGKYPSCTHRVINSAKKRYSIVFQLRAEPNTMISTTEGTITVEEWMTKLKKNLKSINGSY